MCGRACAQQPAIQIFSAAVTALPLLASDEVTVLSFESTVKLPIIQFRVLEAGSIMLNRLFLFARFAHLGIDAVDSVLTTFIVEKLLVGHFDFGLTSE